MIPSTLGFIYTSDLSKVLLIKKQKPVFHKDKLNGLGGKNEVGETTRQCIVREVLEEAGLNILTKDWQKIGSLKWTEWQVTVFVAIYKGKDITNKIMKENQVAWYSVKDLPDNIISNLSWLVPMGVDVLKQNKFGVTIKYKD